MSRVLGWTVRRVGYPTLLILTLLALSLACTAWSLSSSVRGLDFELLAVVLALGAGSGWLAARSHLRGRVALPLALGAAVLLVFVRIGQLGSPLLALLGAALETAWRAQFRQWEPARLLESFELVRAGSATLLGRVGAWALAAQAGQPGFDPAAAALVWSWVLALLAVWTAWQVRRAARPLTALAPLVILLGLVLAFTGKEPEVLLVLLAAWLGLMVVVPQAARERRWKQQALPHADELGLDLAFVVVPAMAVLLVAAALLPFFSPEEIARAVRAWTAPRTETTDAFTHSLGLIPAPRPPSPLDAYRAPGLPRQHLLGASPQLLQKLAFTVATDEEPTGETAPLYWRSTTYDVYTGRGWLTSNVELSSYGAGERVPGAASPLYRPLEQTVQLEGGGDLVYAAGEVLSVDHAFQVARRTEGDVFAVEANAGAYRVESQVPAFEAAALRAAGSAYPEWVRARYLTLPDGVPPRVLALARDLTATAPTPYERARALESYLRTLPYTLNVPAPPVGRDVADYFLFDLRRGYCDYYATAMAVLARAAGLPARLAVGYATGRYDAATKSYRVTEAEAHSWTQIFFPGYGWVDFEPTSGRSVFAYNLPPGEPRLPPPASSDGNASLMRGDLVAPWMVPGGVLLLLLVPLLLLGAERWRLAHAQPEAVLRVLYRRVYRAARDLGLPVTPGHTPREVARLLAAYFGSPGPSALQAALGEPVSAVGTAIAELYDEVLYGAVKPGRAPLDALVRRSQSMRLRVWLAILLAKTRVH